MAFFTSSSLIISLFDLKESLRLTDVGEPVAFSAKLPSVTDADLFSYKRRLSAMEFLLEFPLSKLPESSFSGDSSFTF
jgi:hypothetical protein